MLEINWSDKESFEKGMERLEVILQDLQEGEFSPKESLTIIGEGVEIVRLWSRRLQRAEKKLPLLMSLISELGQGNKDLAERLERQEEKLEELEAILKGDRGEQ